METAIIEADLSQKMQDLKNLINNHSRALQKLKEQQAVFGVYTPPHILMGIEDNEAKIEELQTQLKDIESELETSIKQKKRVISIKVIADVNIGKRHKGEATIGVFGSAKPLIEFISQWASIDPEKFDYSWFLLNPQKSRQSIDDIDNLRNRDSRDSTLYLSNRFG
ncbi:MAG: hypothetical protein H6632_03600 [Anaerolineales bacterium]|nr:hypothetical protein [Anaerolineales bacterium]